MTDFVFLGSKISEEGDSSYEIKRFYLLGRKTIIKQDSKLKSRDITFANKVLFSQSNSFSSIHVWMWVLDHKEGWAPKNWCFRTAVLEKILESPLDNKQIKPINLEGNQPWIFIERTDADAEALILRPLMQRANSLEKTLVLGKIEGRKRRGQQRIRCLDGITDSVDMSFSKPEDNEEQGSLACCSSWGYKESHKT